MSALLDRYNARIAAGELTRDPLQEKAAQRLEALAAALARYRPGKRRLLFAQAPPPKGLYIWGDVGRGKSMLMDLFFDVAPMRDKRRVHFNAFMADTHARIHAERQSGDTNDPIPPVARAIAKDAPLLCFDEFQVIDVADAMILGRLFEQLFELGVVVVTTSNTAPAHLYEGGLNRQLFLPFIALIERRLDVVELNGDEDYRRQRMAGLDLYIMPLGSDADARMDAAWMRLTDRAKGEAASLEVFGRDVAVPRAAGGVARFTFSDLCASPLAGADYVAIARAFHTLLVDNIPVMDPRMRNEARRFALLIDTLYDEGTTLICSAAAPADRLYVEGDGTDAFRRTVSRLIEMQGADYLDRRRGPDEAAQ
jgi:cell division protein ZapE